MTWDIPARRGADRNMRAGMIGAMSTATLDASRKRMVLVACILGTTVVTVDSTAINVALPAIAQDLGGGLAGQQWTANAYLLTLSSLLLIGGSLGDVIGERRVFFGGGRGQAVGAWTAWGGIGTVLGPVIGGQLVDSASWRWIFLLNLPLVLGPLFIVSRAVPADAPRAPGPRVGLRRAAL